MKEKNKGAIVIISVLVCMALIITGAVIWLTRGNKSDRPSAEELLCQAAGLDDMLRESAKYNESDRMKLLMLEQVKFDVLEYTDTEISVRVTAPDMAKIMDEILYDDSIVTTEDMTARVCDIFENGSFSTVSNEVTAAVAKDEYGWYIEESYELADAVNGGLLSYYEALLEEGQ